MHRRGVSHPAIMLGDCSRRTAANFLTGLLRASDFHDPWTRYLFPLLGSTLQTFLTLPREHEKRPV